MSDEIKEVKPPSEADLHNSAFWHIQKFYDSCFKGKVYGPSVLDRIRKAPDEEALKQLLEAEWPGASSGTRRKWAKAAERRYADLA